MSCEPQGTDRYGRRLAVWGLNACMVCNGQAVAYRPFSRRYVVEEDDARDAGRGIWATEFQMPSDLRQRN